MEGLNTKAASVHIRCVLSGEAEGFSGHARCINGSADFDRNETVCLVVSKNVIAQVLLILSDARKALTLLLEALSFNPTFCVCYERPYRL